MKWTETKAGNWESADFVIHRTIRGYALYRKEPYECVNSLIESLTSAKALAEHITELGAV